MKTKHKRNNPIESGIRKILKKTLNEDSGYQGTSRVGIGDNLVIIVDDDVDLIVLKINNQESKLKFKMAKKFAQYILNTLSDRGV